jgi:hypothetical protein
MVIRSEHEPATLFDLNVDEPGSNAHATAQRYERRQVTSKHPSLWHMEDIAWVLRTDAKRRAIGFVRAKDPKLADRHVLDDDE